MCSSNLPPRAAAVSAMSLWMFFGEKLIVLLIIGLAIWGWRFGKQGDEDK